MRIRVKYLNKKKTFLEQILAHPTSEITGEIIWKVGWRVKVFNRLGKQAEWLKLGVFTSVF